jgi:hypothetical protein
MVLLRELLPQVIFIRSLLGLAIRLRAFFFGLTMGTLSTMMIVSILGLSAVFVAWYLGRIVLLGWLARVRHWGNPFRADGESSDMEAWQ